MNKYSSAIFTATLIFSTMPVLAGKISASSHSFRSPVVELYTSEGCSSCPPADEWISKLGDTIDADFHAVPLAFHVDYWNRLGWPDPFSNSEFTDRQRELAAINQQRSIYTPEFLVSGDETRGTGAVVRAIQSANAEPATVNISVDVDNVSDSEIKAELKIANMADDAVLYLAIFENDINREIKGGENSGRTLHHDFVVRHWQRATAIKKGEYQGSYNIEIGDDWSRSNIGFAAIVLDGNTSKTLQAMSTPLAAVFEVDS